MKESKTVINLFPLNSYTFTKPYLARVCEGQNRVYKSFFTPLAVKPFYIFANGTPITYFSYCLM